jgi:copper resistance protein B
MKSIQQNHRSKNSTGRVAALLSGFLACSAHAGMMDDPTVSKLTVNHLEISNQDHNPVHWDADFWVKQYLDKLVLRSAGESAQGQSHSQNSLLYGRAITPFWDVEFGLGHDIYEQKSHNWGIVGLSGLAPYFFETQVQALVDGNGKAGVRLMGEYDALLTQKWILSPEIEVAAYSDDIPEIGLGSGLSSMSLGLRLRYEIKRELAPYVGVEWHKLYGDTAKFQNEDQQTSLVAGIRFWF